MNRHVFIETPDVENGLELTLEQERMCKVVYKKDTTNSDDGYFFHSLWNPEQDYDDEYIIVPLRSTNAQAVPWGAGKEFANVIGSTYDPKQVPEYINEHWINLYKRIVRIAHTVCATDGYFYNSSDEEPLDSVDYPCSGVIVGGHVVQGQTARAGMPGSNDDVFIVPICNNHNTKNYPKSTPKNPVDTGAGFFMKLKEDVEVLQLSGYMQG